MLEFLSTGKEAVSQQSHLCQPVFIDTERLIAA